MPLKGGCAQADTRCVDAAERQQILDRYLDHSRRFEEVAARRRSVSTATAAVIPFQSPRAEVEQEPTGREIEVLQLISDGLVNREIGQRLFLDRKSTRLNSSHLTQSRMPSS